MRSRPPSRNLDGPDSGTPGRRSLRSMRPTPVQPASSVASSAQRALMGGKRSSVQSSRVPGGRGGGYISR